MTQFYLIRHGEPQWDIYEYYKSKELGLEIMIEFDLREWQPDLTFEYDSLKRLKELGEDYDVNHGVYPPG